MSLKMQPKLLRAKDGKKQTVLGDAEIVKLSGADTNGQFLLIEQNSEPGVGIPMHVHTNEDEVFRVLEGHLKVVISGEEHILDAGDTIFCPRSVPHSWEIVGDKRAKVLLMNFPAGLELMLAELSRLEHDAAFDKIADISKRYGIHFLSEEMSD